jgi:hypothetical protein
MSNKVELLQIGDDTYVNIFTICSIDMEESYEGMPSVPAINTSDGDTRNIDNEYLPTVKAWVEEHKHVAKDGAL